MNTYESMLYTKSQLSYELKDILLCIDQNRDAEKGNPDSRQLRVCCIRERRGLKENRKEHSGNIQRTLAGKHPSSTISVLCSHIRKPNTKAKREIAEENKKMGQLNAWDTRIMTTVKMRNYPAKEAA